MFYIGGLSRSRMTYVFVNVLSSYYQPWRIPLPQDQVKIGDIQNKEVQTTSV